MNWLEFVMLAVAALLGMAGILAIVALSLILIKWAVRDIARSLLDTTIWIRAAYKRITA